MAGASVPTAGAALAGVRMGESECTVRSARHRITPVANAQITASALKSRASTSLRAQHVTRVVTIAVP